MQKFTTQTGQAIAGAAVSLFLLAACAETYTTDGSTACKTPLPADFTVTPPAESVPPEYAKFSGIWGDGKWEGKLCHTLVVTEVNEDGSVSAIYSHGRYEGWNIHHAGFFTLSGVIEDGVLELERLGTGVKANYRFQGEKLLGSYRLNRRSEVILTKQAS